MEYRVLTPDDAEEYLRIRLEGLKGNPEAFATTYEDKVNEKDALKKTAGRLTTTDDVFTMGAFSDGKLVSVVTFVREMAPKLHHKASIFAVYTSPEYRGKGIARQLFLELLEKVKGFKGLEQLHLTVVSDNLAAIHLYKSLGFEKFGTEKNAMKHGDRYWDEDLMALFLKW
ncbi:GNAT family N-acetyltransferase [Falsibacillus albus]|uniref:GNAT family N-acetyltransferase n=1 Tax=Falsibacillus albus TaxID=2478915 RepID=A0A3L7K0X3_9BACI|nr:GNAT family N-acetyltransferase [Falsibacillus albus]RLQ96723.1 GNAT family N-acetyltransferase [Falsibacillus albus]